jgi:general stress protein YciG
LEGIRQSWKDQEDWRKLGRVGGMTSKVCGFKQSWRESGRVGGKAGREGGYQVESDQAELEE